MFYNMELCEFILFYNLLIAGEEAPQITPLAETVKRGSYQEGT